MTVRVAGAAARTSVRAALLSAIIIGAAAGAAAQNTEFAPADDPTPESQADETVGEPLAQNPSLAASLGWTMFKDEDMDATYGGMPWAGVELTAAIGPQTEVYVLVEYGRATGDPYHDVTAFTGPEIRLRAVPTTFGVKLNTSQNLRVAFHLGIGVQVCWVEEEVPVAPAGEADAYRGYTGWGSGFLLNMGPEWRTTDGRRGLGLDLSWGGSDVEVGPRTDDHLVSTLGAKARLYVRWRL